MSENDTDFSRRHDDAGRAANDAVWQQVPPPPQGARGKVVPDSDEGDTGDTPEAAAVAESASEALRFPTIATNPVSGTDTGVSDSSASGTASVETSAASAGDGSANRPVQTEQSAQAGQLAQPAQAANPAQTAKFVQTDQPAQTEQPDSQRSRQLWDEDAFSLPEPAAPAAATASLPAASSSLDLGETSRLPVAPHGGANAPATITDLTGLPRPLEETYKDPLLRAPRRSSVVLCIAFGVVLLALAALTWWVSVRTITGQQYDDLVWETLKDGFPALLLPVVEFFTRDTYVIGLIIVIGIVSVVMVLIRRRWRLLVQLAAFALVSFLCGYTLKRILPRTSLDPSLANPDNTSPSGHSVAAFAAAVVLILAVPLSVRAIAAVISFIFASGVGLSVVVEKWHRPSDVVVAFLLVSGLALITLAFTRASGMDKAGARRSSASIQILSTVMIVAGLFSTLFAGYLLWNIVPGLGQEAVWTLSAAQSSAILAISGVAGLCLGLVLGMRQITASPLSTIGRVGAPPAPPAGSQLSPQ